MRKAAIGILGILLLLTGCGRQTAQEPANAKAIGSMVVWQEERTEEEFREQAAAMVQTIFGVDVSGYESEITIEDLEIRFSPGQGEQKRYYVVGWRDGEETPCWLYQMGMPKENTKNTMDSNILPDNARDFLTQTLGVEGLSDTVELYTYSDRFAVLLRDTEGMRYHVVYTQADGELCGYQIFSDEASCYRFYERQGAEEISGEK